MRRAVLVLALAGAGCVTLSSQEKAVRIVNNLEQVRACQERGNVQIEGYYHAGTAAAWRAFRRRVLEAGGDTGYVISVSGGGNHPDIVGTAYRCEQAPR